MIAEHFNFSGARTLFRNDAVTLDPPMGEWVVELGYGYGGRASTTRAVRRVVRFHSS